MADMDSIASDVKYIRARLDLHIDNHAKDAKDIEGRLTKVEVKSGLWGALGGILTALGLHFKSQ
jgi:hypothetical protein